MKKDLLLTFFVEVIILISGILVYKFAANLIGKDAFSQYALSRRAVSFIFPVLVMGLTVGIPRYIAFANSNNEKHPDIYFLAGFLVLFTNVLFIALTLNLFKAQFAFLFFGNKEFENLIFPISIIITGLMLHALCYGYYRGKLLMRRANILQLLNMGVVPVVVFIYQDNIAHILFLTGLYLVVISTFSLILIGKNLSWSNITSVIPSIKELLTYGIQRVPGDCGMAALITLPAIITAHTVGIKEAGYVAFGITILNMTGSLFAPVGLVFLPKASQLIAAKHMDKLKEYIVKLASFTILLTFAGLIFFEVFANQIITSYLGDTFSDLIVIARIIMLGCLASTFYVSMRSILDAYHFKSVNTINIVIALIFFLTASSVVYALDGNHIALISSFVAALYVLGGLTLSDIMKLLKVKSKEAGQSQLQYINEFSNET